MKALTIYLIIMAVLTVGTIHLCGPLTLRHNARTFEVNQLIDRVK